MAHRLALATLAATCVLILFGGLVTNTGAALAVPDWPSTFGHNMFLFPWSGMVGGIFYEHSHRLIGALVGVLTLGLAAALWPLGGRLRRLGLLAVIVVLAQGLLGGLRVVLLHDTLAIFHGSLAQAFFALLAAIALLTAPRGAVAGPPIAREVQGLALLAAGLVYAQIVFGALLTHAGRVDLHLAGAVAVFVVLPIVTARLRRTGDVVAVPVSRLLLGLLGIQLLLGIGSFLARFSSLWIPGEQLTVLILPVAHRLLGSLLLAATVVLAVRALTLAKKEAEQEKGSRRATDRALTIHDAVDRAPRSHAVSTGDRAPRSHAASFSGQAPRSHAVSTGDRAPRSHAASFSGHPRYKAASRTPLQ